MDNKESRFQTILECSRIGTWEWNVQTGETLFNETWAQILGYTLDELAPVSIKTWEILAHPEDLEASGKLLERHFSGELPYYDFESRMKHKNGHWVWVHDRGKVVSWSDDGKPLMMLGSHDDITGRKQVEQELRKIEWMFTSKPTMFHSISPENDIDNQGYGDLTALNSGGLISCSIDKGMLKDISMEYLNLLETSSAIYEKNGDYAYGVFCSGWCRMMDSASRKLCQTGNNEAALASGKWLCHESCWTNCSKRAIESGSPVEIECNGGINLYAVPIFSAGEVIGAINFGYGEPPRDAARLRSLADSYGLDPESLIREAQAYSTRPTFIVELAKIRLASSARLIGIMVERKRAEEALRKSEQEKSLILDNVGDIIAYHDKNGCIVWANQAYLDSVSSITGSPVQIAEIKGGRCYEVWKLGKQCLGCPVSIALQTGQTTETELSPDNQPHWPATQGSWYVRATPLKDNKGNVIGAIELSRNITARKKLEDALKNSQKLESLGILAGGIAHDFNNLMGGIFGYIDMASEATKEVKATSYLSKAMNTIERARALTGQLLTFAKGGAPIRKIDHLFPFVEETAKFALSGANVSCNFDMQQDLWACNFDKNQIGQVIDNLIINAQQAMPVGGTIELTARNVTLSEKEHPLLENGNYVKLSIKDTGIGIPKDMIDKIFDPFFTTKAKGHGLGLATCYSIINRHGGCIDVESEQGKGSTFKVYLPAATEAVSSVNENAAKTHKGSGTFLVMDDEEVMRDTIGDMLETLGYTVISKENGKDAIDFFVSETKANRLITGMIFDLTVPGGMGGKDTIENIRKINPSIPCFVASGYADDPVMKNPTEYGFMASICKPFRKSELSEMLNNYLKKDKNFLFSANAIAGATQPAATRASER